ncbi:MAG: ATP-binding cassette domain-containing protein [bacterium]|nr:ATP-binding cassette domain-containing protein [bacterium]
MTNAVIHAKDLFKTFGDTIAVDGLTFSVEPGQIVALLGPNGAGKTTTIHMLTTLLPIESGTASVAGFDVATAPHAVRQNIGLAGQTAAVDEKLTARENLRLFGRFYKIPKDQLKKRVDELVTEFRMDDYANRPAETYSGGQRRRLDVVAALIATPPAVFFDEPTTGLDPRSRAELWEAILGLARSGAAIVLTTQYLEEADRLADEIVLIDEGREIARGTPEQLKRGLERDVLEIHFADAPAFEAGVELLHDQSLSESDADGQLIQIAVGGSTGASLGILRRLDDAGIQLADFQLRRPTLDDVFLTLTKGSEEGGR